MIARWALVLVAAAALAACGGDDADDGVASLDDVVTTTTVAPAEVDSEAQLIRFAACMRGQGIDLADPTVDADGNLQLEPPPGFELSDLDELQAAAAECEEFLEGVTLGFEDIDLTAVTDTLVEFAACMRENGYDLPDPDLSLLAPGNEVPSAGPFGDVDLADQDFLDALEQCQSILIDLGVPQP